MTARVHQRSTILARPVSLSHEDFGGRGHTSGYRLPCKCRETHFTKVTRSPASWKNRLIGQLVRREGCILIGQVQLVVDAILTHARCRTPAWRKQMPPIPNYNFDANSRQSHGAWTQWNLNAPHSGVHSFAGAACVPAFLDRESASLNAHDLELWNSIFCTSFSPKIGRIESRPPFSLAVVGHVTTP